MDCNPPGSSVRGIFQARILECVAVLSPGDLPDPGVEPVSLMPPSLAGRFFTASTTWEAPPNHFVKLVTKKSSDVMLRLFL